ncbi:bacterial low temperature requirement A protein-domain-containing protein [Bisporella sp. PMI_857]|nr:bacterial low temperature requirement A protein-domain-containing protein [Bisporella sp. PMI_857]
MFEFTISHDSEAGSTSESALNPKELEEHKIALLPWIQSPFKHSDTDDLNLELRHESNNLELFFDLFFIANLSTFTSTHSIIDTNTLVAYIGLFAILWFTWFQITLHDVRFSIDSVYERVCKTIQFIIFVGFALSFRILCWLLFMSRLLFAIQYGVALYFIRRKTKALTWPISLTITALVLMGGAFYSMTPAFSPSSGNGLGIYYVWYIILAIEFGIVIGLSSIWRQLSFRSTHLMERMGLLTLIVIGEGAIGVTKTVGKLMGKSGVTFEGCTLVICIILIMMFLWMFYFDNRPQHHYGTVRQQFWAGLHFPLHIGVVGVLEGSQQIAIGRYIFKSFVKIENDIHEFCVKQHLDGTALANALTQVMKELKLEDKLESRDQAALIMQELYNLTNVTGICSEANTSNIPAFSSIPTTFDDIMIDIFGALFQNTGINLPSGVDPSELGRSTFLTVYIYYWASICLTMASFAALFWLTKHEEQRAALFEKIALYGRIIAAVIAAIFVTAVASRIFLFYFIRSPAILPTVASIFVIIVVCDRVGRQLSVRKLKMGAASAQQSIKLSLFRHGSGQSGQPGSAGYIRTPSIGSCN